MIAWAVLFVVSALAIWLTYAGYPLLLRFWVARRFSDGVQLPELPGDSQCPHVCALISACNEQDRVVKKVHNILAQDYPAERLRAIVVSDGSTDETVARLQSLNEPRLTVLARETRSGKAACLNHGAKEIDEDEIILFLDARQALNPPATRALVSHFADERVGAVSGELVFRVADDAPRGFEASMSDYWQQEVQIRRDEAAIHSVAGATGALYAMRRSLFQPVPSELILDDVMIPMNAVLAGYMTKFDRRAIAYDTPSTVRAKERVRKVRTLAGNFQLLAMNPRLASPWHNPIFLQFFLHKVMRLLAPFFLFLMLLASAMLSTYIPWFVLLVAAQLGVYALVVVPDHWRLPGLLGKARTFAVMHWFVVLGFVEFLTNRRAHLWGSS